MATLAPPDAEAAPAASHSDAWRRLRRDRASLAGAACLAALVLIAIFAPLVAPQDPIRVAMRDRLQTPAASTGSAPISSAATS